MANVMGDSIGAGLVQHLSRHELATYDDPEAVSHHENGVIEHDPTIIETQVLWNNTLILKMALSDKWIICKLHCCWRYVNCTGLASYLFLHGCSSSLLYLISQRYVLSVVLLLLWLAIFRWSRFLEIMCERGWFLFGDFPLFRRSISRTFFLLPSWKEKNSHPSYPRILWELQGKAMHQGISMGN